MSFCVKIIERAAPEGLAYAEIVLAEFKEAFQADLSFWSKRDYETQWRQAVERIIAGESRFLSHCVHAGSCCGKFRICMAHVCS